MNLDWNAFTPGAALAGGLIIGLAAALLALAHGKVLGVSGILGGLLRRTDPDRWGRLAFVAGLVCAGAVAYALGLHSTWQVSSDWALLVAGGLLVGLGTRMASGCTSGHGVCGLSMGSPRSLVATLCFMGLGMATVSWVRHGVVA